ncbi:phosphotransferase family protein [Novosphingobium pentaromativorans]|uniref:Aminoglycoside phosphotransferase domain-containing protein n=1 Tax=Novosphingobium pentaromativorans US6-1 TaxID=1088721 RepID=G6E856_9SPHN|nr:phosphotransferase family protein [Novosphingobium pentaromativorans]EHJ62396.1 hypothetical protein NSU_0527 [Novosphingobium pentaromativorans US6-1]
MAQGEVPEQADDLGTDGGQIDKSIGLKGRDASITEATVVAPEVRDLGALSKQLANWLSDRMPGASDIAISNLSYPLGAGMSHETILFDAQWQRHGRTEHRGMVVRIKPTGLPVYQDDLFDKQYDIMQLMHRSGAVPVAEPLWFEADPALLGAPFFMMAKVHGRVAVSYPPYCKQGWVVDSSPEDRRTMWEDAVRHLALIQTVPVSQAKFLDLPGTFDENFDQEVDRWRRYLDWIDPDRALALLRGEFDRLLQNHPANRPEGIVWGDARLGNMMIGEDYKVVAVMDWEQPSVGGALHDLGWWLYSDHLQTEGRGLAPLDGMGTREETIALWGQTCGIPTDDIEWYEAFACFKMECLRYRMVSLDGRMPATGREEPGHRTARMLDSAYG